MENVRFPYLVYLAMCLLVSVVSQDQSGFISIDCGIPSGSSYTDDTTGINYVSDSSFVETGGKGKKYLIRASFLYGNYDGEASSPEFDLFLGGNLWTALSLNNTPDAVTKEVVYLSQSEKIFVCLGNRGKGTPFISTLELRFLGNDNTTYDSPNGALFFSRRWNFCSLVRALTASPIRYSEDVYDRIWLPRNLGAQYKEINTSLSVTSGNNSYNLPGLLMTTALTPTNTTAPISMELADPDPTVRYFVYMHFAEVEDLSLTPNQTREFEIYINEVKIADFSPRYLQTDTFFLKPESQTNIKFSLVRTPTSTLPPLINALEIYIGNTYSQSFTSQEDDDAVTSIKTSYKVKRNWQGDPCLPNSYIWEGLNCSYASLSPPRITLLNLSSSGLTGHISPSFSNLTMIEELDLSNNDLTGDIPESLSKLRFLRVLNLEKNKLTGSVPSELLERSKSGSLLLRVGDNPGLCTEVSCVKSNKKILMTTLVASFSALFILLLMSGVFWKIKKRSNKSGGFGTVYHGYYNNLQVAVKLLSATSAQGFKEFRSEVEVLVRVHHVNLTALIGYFHESDQMGLVYEFMANGNMEDHLSGKYDHTLSWIQRLQVALDAAQGLEYLHSGCKPAIVHRDVKTSNILLDEKNRAKLADFGLSRSFQTESRSHVSTLVAGTPGYLDPLCFKTNELNEKSDVYSFGVVLLEMITGKAVISESQMNRVHVSDWVVSILKSTNDVSNVTDPRMQKDFDANSVWKIVELALASVWQNVAERPNMQEIVRGLKEFHCQDQSAGFISIDCGIPSGSSYTDDTTGINYVSDSSFVETGASKTISFPTQRQLQNLRSFPEGSRNCYTLTPEQGKGKKYLIRASFLYGNYDRENSSPEFDLFLGVNLWTTLSLNNTPVAVTKEVIYLSHSDKIFVCLGNKGKGTPFMSTLELRFLGNDNTTYESPNGALFFSRRWNFGSLTESPIRYSEDVYDRIWIPRKLGTQNREINTSHPVTAGHNNRYNLSSLVMSTAVTPRNATTPMIMVLENSDPTVRFTLKKTPKSTLPPLINAIEIYVGNTYSQSFTSQEDDDAVTSIKMSYKVTRNWQGDPCLPRSYIWEGLNCSYPSHAPPRITLLHLSSSGLTGRISPSFSNLTMIQELDLSNNDLTGDIPESLSGLKFLRVLNLEKNKLTGSVPSELLERSKSGSLLLRVGENPGLCTEVSCGISNKKTPMTVLLASFAALFILLLLSGVFWKIKKQSNKSVNSEVEEETDKETSNHPKVDSNTLLFTFQDIVKMTNNFGRVLGKGGLGTVYHGYYNNLEVAVKLLSETSAQGFKEFRSEVEVLVRLHHVNLTALIGYFHESDQMGFIYEFMANGNMEDHLLGRYDHTLSWAQRLQIALDAAQGLEYLHSGCKPAIAHRDVKTSNILLDEKHRAKLADFGLSRSFRTESRSHVSTLVAGTPGYLDPLSVFSLASVRCFKTNELNEKSDIYSFGVVLLEIITGKTVINELQMKRVHVSDWVISILKSTNDVSIVVDSKMGRDFDANSVWKIVELALASVSQNVYERPNMQQIVRGLEEWMEFSGEAGMMMENKRSVCSLEESSIKRHKSDLSFSSKQRKDKAGERISALQQIVSPYGKTDTASVLQDALHYIEFLHDQVKVLSAPYLQTMTAATQEELELYSLRNRGLCLVPMEYTAGVAQSNGADIWAPVKTPPSPAFGVKSQSPFR
ncbi:hypothetical protein Bca101_052575 [Brassica carinata]